MSQHTYMQGTSSASPESSGWGDQHPGLYAGTESPDEGSSQYQPMGVLHGFDAMQKKVTRDGQPAKRRGPKPDSKPAQTRRQELNRQAQRTHRERKEQYIKALEIEVARLREEFARECTKTNTFAKQNEIANREFQQEIMILRDMLASRGIRYEAELESRKSSLRMGGRDASSLSPSHINNRPYNSGIPGPPSSTGYSTAQEQRVFPNGSTMSTASASPGTRYNSRSPPIGPDIREQAQAEYPTAVSDMPMGQGIFEREPQLGIDFILALESICHGHGEYLVRRSVTSPDEPETALFSGHALMASCPPPSHIDSNPAQKGGLEPTYPHQAPDVPLTTLTTLLNLSQRIKDQGFVDGGQVTPIMALQALKGHKNYASLNRDDIVGMIEGIRNKVRCYGFGAVMEDFELDDALTSVFLTKPEAYEDMGIDDIDDMYS